MKGRLLVAALALALVPTAAAAAPQVEARAWRVENAATGEVLLRHRDAERVPIASITKLMTVLVALEHTRPDDVVTVHPQAAAVGESTMDLRPGERVTARDLVAGALVQSANDAAWALALHVGGGSAERFVARMNLRARRLGLRDTHFVRPDGLDVAGHVSSARDVSLLARAAMRHPVVRDLARRRSVVAAGRTLHTWNDLLGRFPGLVGVKTGHTRAAGWSQVAAARGRGFTIYASILGSPTRAQRNADLAELLAWGLSRYRTVPLVQAERVYARVPVQYGRAPVPLVAQRPLVRVVRLGSRVVERLIRPAALTLPVARGQRLGRVVVEVDGRVVASSPLVAAAARTRPGVAARLGWYARRTVANLATLGGLAA